MVGIGIAVNALFPVGEAIAGTWLYVRVDKGLGSSESLEDVLSVSIVGVCLTQIISGWILISSVYKIKKYINHDTETKVNIKTLIV